MGLDDVAIEAEQDRAAIDLGIQPVVDAEQGAAGKEGAQFAQRGGGEFVPEQVHHGIAEAFGRLEHHVSGETIRHDDIHGIFEQIEAFDVTNEIQVQLGAESGGDPRELELVNKTNQFNLNGIRFGEADWRTRLAEPGAILASVTYRDKFGPLGKIAVLQGRQEGPVLRIGVWVMSCRAFSRRIEHYCLKSLFERFGSRELFFEFAPTSKNGPLQDFFAQFLGGRPAAAFALSRERFQSACPPLFHRATSWEKVQADG